MFAKKLLVAGGLMLSMAACNVEGALNDLENDIVNAAFENIKEAAEEKGGTAVMVHAGAEATMEVTDESSALFGAKVVIPADALPEGTKRAAATIQGAELNTPQPDHVKAAGPFAAVALLGLPSGLPVELQSAAVITLPYAKDVSYPTAELALGQFADDVTIPADSAVDTRSETVAGSSKDLKGLFAAVWEVTYDGTAVEEGVYAYNVMKGEELVCVGQQDDVIVGEASIDQSNNIAAITFLLAAGAGNSITVESAALDKDPGAATLPLAIPDVSITVTCNGASFAKATGVNGLSITSWTETAAQAIATCVNPDDCFVKVGTVGIAGTVSYTADGTGEAVKAGINVTIDNFSWYYN